jgi:hypothetical protein
VVQNTHTEPDEADKPVADGGSEHRTFTDRCAHLFRALTRYSPIGVVIVTGFYTCISFGQWSILKDTLRESRRSFEESRRSFQVERRPYVTIRSARLTEPLTVGKRARAMVEVVNGGQTPALEMSIYSELMFVTGYYAPEKKTPAGKVSEGVLGPGSVMVSFMELPAIQETDKRFVDWFLEGNAHIYLQGTILYTDLFQEKRETMFCYHVTKGASPDLTTFAACDRNNTVK